MQNGATRVVESMPNNIMEKGCRMMEDGGNGMMGGGRQVMERNMIMNQGGDIMHMVHAGFAILFGLALLAIVIIAAIWIYRLMNKYTCGKVAIKQAATFETALEILSRRYAEGVINTEEYLERKQHLIE
jgi:uncharacterized membrane protein